MKSLALFLVLLATSNHLHSEEIRYIRDQLYVPLRSGQTMQHRIVHKGLVSGTAVTIEETSEDDKYSLVRTKRGTEGWIQTQYLSAEPAGRDLYKTANEKLGKVQQQNTLLSQQLNTLKTKDKQSQKKLSSLLSEGDKLGKELSSIKDISANAIQLNSDNKISDKQYLVS